MVKYGIYGLVYWNNGMKQFFVICELYWLDDVKGLVFCIQLLLVLEVQFVMFGVIVKQLFYVEIFKVMQVGSVQGIENIWLNFVGQKIDSVQLYIIEINYGVFSYMLIISLVFWIGIFY